jgi:hypothetical protein
VGVEGSAFVSPGEAVTCVVAVIMGIGGVLLYLAPFFGWLR